MSRKRFKRRMRQLRKRESLPWKQQPTLAQKWDVEGQRFYWARHSYDPETQTSATEPYNWQPTAPLYFAYGSNLSMQQMRRRACEATPYAAFVLPNWKLVFRGVADITPAEGMAVQGGLWRITGADEMALDRYEGVAGGMYFKEYFSIAHTLESGERVTEDVLFYMMTSDGREAEPWTHYLDGIREGYADFGLDQSALDAAVAAAPKSTYAGYSYNWSRPAGALHYANKPAAPVRGAEDDYYDDGRAYGSTPEKDEPLPVDDKISHYPGYGGDWSQYEDEAPCSAKAPWRGDDEYPSAEDDDQSWSGHWFRRRD